MGTYYQFKPFIAWGETANDLEQLLVHRPESLPIL